MEFVWSAAPDATKARRLVREPERPSHAPSSPADNLDRDLDALERDLVAGNEVVTEAAAALGVNVQDYARGLLNEAAQRVGLDPPTAEEVERLTEKPTSGLVRSLRPMVRSGSFIGDLHRVADPERNVPEADRAAAILRLAQRFPRPVHSTRWPAVEQELRRLSDSREERQRILRERVASAVAEVAPLVYVLPMPAREQAKWFRSCVNDVVTEDLLGSHWREPQREEFQPPAFFDEPSPEVLDSLTAAEAPASSLDEWITALKPKATPRERELLELLEANPAMPPAEAAHRLGVRAHTLQVMVGNLRRKVI